MRVTKVYADGFRNLENVSITPYEDLNVICGNNAQGKTNLMEAIWMATGLKSFRGAKDKELLGFDKDMASLSVSFDDGDREQTVEFCWQKNPYERRITLNGVPKRSTAELCGKLRAVYFTPDDLSIPKGVPEGRRNYIDQCVAQIKPTYRGVYSKYIRVMTQRNNTLKQISLGFMREDMLDVWDTQLAALGAYITVLRREYSKKLDMSARELYNELTDGRENISLKYSSTVFDESVESLDFRGELADIYCKKLCEARQNDIRFLSTSVGVHRDDLTILLNNIPAKDHGSQGQIRSIALCMKLAQAKILKEELDRMPIMLLDDVLSELDPQRQDFILNRIKDMQVFITCCDPIEKLGRNLFKVSEGKIG